MPYKCVAPPLFCLMLYCDGFLWCNFSLNGVNFLPYWCILVQITIQNVFFLRSAPRSGSATRRCASETDAPLSECLQVDPCQASQQQDKENDASVPAE